MVIKPLAIDRARPLFERYLQHMKQYVEINDVEDWKNRAIEYFNLYTTDPERHAYILFASEGESEVIGFALVNRIYRFNIQGNVVAEFYISQEKQGQGFGRELAQYVFSQQPGDWEICVLSGNDDAFQFWEKVVSSYVDGNYKTQSKESYDGKAFCFTSTQ